MLKYLREEVKNLVSYNVLEGEFQVKLDANEAPDRIDGLNRYPVDGSTPLRTKLATMLGKDPEELLMGNGSSELIELVMKAYLGAGETVASFSPTFSMYKQFTVIHKGVYRDYPLDGMKRLNVDGFIDFVEEAQAKLVLICNPNNPTGTMLSRVDVLKIVSSVKAMVVLDQAYLEFSDYPQEDDTRDNKNLIVLRSFSKAMGLAGIRLGYMIAHQEIIGYINRVRSPYNVNSLTQEAGLQALENELATIHATTEMIKSERQRMAKGLATLGIKPLPSQGNFLFFPMERRIFEHLTQNGILIRAFGGDLEGYYRLTIGTPEENNAALQRIKEANHARR